jgi:hypothetical protein
VPRCLTLAGLPFWPRDWLSQSSKPVLFAEVGLYVAAAHLGIKGHVDSSDKRF